LAVPLLLDTQYVLVDSRRRSVEICRRTEGAMWLYQRYGDGETAPLESIALTVPVAALYLATGV
jgi:Uma2 family endonuclease